MANQSAPSVPSNMGTIPSTLADFNNADQVDWLVGVQSKAKGEVVCNYGSKRTLSSQSAPYGNGSAKSTLFSTAQGWSAILTNGSSHYQNFELRWKEKNRWCPASIFNGFGGQFKQHNDKAHSMYFTDLALIFMGKYDETFIFTSDGKLSNSKGVKDVYYTFSTQAYIDEIRGWGNDWLFYGVILRVSNPGGAGSDQSEVSCRNFRVFTKASSLSTNHRLICPSPRTQANRAVVSYTDS